MISESTLLQQHIFINTGALAQNSNRQSET